MAKQMAIWDEMGRELKVDLETEYKKWIKWIGNRSSLVQHRAFFEQADLFSQQKDLERFKKEREQILRDLIHQAWSRPATDKVSSSKLSHAIVDEF